MTRFDETINNIQRYDGDEEIKQLIQDRLDSLTKPPGSLGRLEEIVLRYGMMTGSADLKAPKKRIVVFAGDHGVVEEGVSAFPSSVTPMMVKNMDAGGAAVNVLARHAGAEVVIVDVGVFDSLDGLDNVVARKVRRGTGNMLKEAAMSHDEMFAAVETGIECAEQAFSDGITLLGTGEMGIGNTTPSAALFAALLPAETAAVTGAGTGIDSERLTHKTSVIKTALALHRQELADPLRACEAVGGLEIAAICGLILGAARHKIPVVVDGFISTAGALVAIRSCPASLDYCFFSHCSAETGHRVFFDTMRIRPLLDLDMRLGEGTGAALAMSIIDASIKIYNEMATFESAGIARKS